jgi:hypothetical protein
VKGARLAGGGALPKRWVSSHLPGNRKPDYRMSILRKMEAVTLSSVPESLPLFGKRQARQTLVSAVAGRPL